MRKHFDLRGKTAVVTGAASGIGRALALQLASEGAFTVLVDRDVTGLAGTAKEVEAIKGQCRSYTLDLSDPAASDRSADEIIAAHAPVSVLINNAGVAIMGSFSEMSLQDFEWLVRINFGATVQLTKKFLPHLLSQPAARIVNISSVFGLVSPGGQSAYVASKFAVRGFTEALMHELEDTNVAVSCVHPGGIKTAIARNSRIVQADKTKAANMIANFDAVSAITTAQDAARQIAAGMKAGKARILIGRDARRLDRVQRLLPVGYWRMVKRLMDKAALPPAMQKSS